MSYLAPLRLHFAGRFQANISTVNNDPGHFDNAAFIPRYQQMQEPNPTPETLNGWFNPEGDGSWRLRGCRVTSAWMPDSDASPVAGDPVLGLLVADADDNTSAKLVDLDPEQQMVSTIFGLRVRLVDSNGVTVVRGEFEPAPFMDIWDRAISSAGGDTVGGAMFQSVLTNVVWGDVEASPFLTALRADSESMLSIKFNIDGINMDFHSPEFMMGRLVGTIGPATATEPRHLVVGRQFIATEAQTSQMFMPNGSLNFCVARVDVERSTIMFDLGNALQTTTVGGPIVDMGDLEVRVTVPDPGNPFAGPTPMFTIGAQGADGYAADGWYERTAGIVSFPLSGAQLTAVAAAPISIESIRPMPGAGVYISENSSGAFVRADEFVFRMSPGQVVDVSVHASLFGVPLAGATVGFASDSSGLQSANFLPGGVAPPVSDPADALSFPASAVTDANGVATITVTASDPGTPRWFDNGTAYGIDGQVYGIRPSIVYPPDAGASPQTESPWNFVSILLWSGFAPDHEITWADLQPIFTQYANLYPVMGRFLDMSQYESVTDPNVSWMLQLAFGLDICEPNSMPVTRDLSPAKRTAILGWFENDAPRGPAIEPPGERASGGATGATVAADLARRGGKTAASARRRSRQGVGS